MNHLKNYTCKTSILINLCHSRISKFCDSFSQGIFKHDRKSWVLLPNGDNTTAISNLILWELEQ